MSKLQNRVAIVTGVARGLGAVYAKALVVDGEHVMHGRTDYQLAGPIVGD
jgi:NAD(P)-dependent dehydrogenase (short-subunit alcohol dehydrogenase family)